MSKSQKFRGTDYKFAEITQGQLEDFSERISDTSVSGPVFRGNAVRAAIEVGWITEPKLEADSVRSMAPALVIWLFNTINALMAEATTIDPQS